LKKITEIKINNNDKKNQPRDKQELSLEKARKNI